MSTSRLRDKQSIDIIFKKRMHAWILMEQNKRVEKVQKKGVFFLFVPF